MPSFSVHPLEIIPVDSWLARVREGVYHTSDSSQPWAEENLEASLLVNPAAKLLDFFEEVLGSQDQKYNVFEIEKTLKVGPKLRSIPQFKFEWMQKWIGE